MIKLHSPWVSNGADKPCAFGAPSLSIFDIRDLNLRSAPVFYTGALRLFLFNPHANALSPWSYRSLRRIWKPFFVKEVPK